MTTQSSGAAAFAGLVDLAAEALGGKALFTNDDFFAEKENLLKTGRAIFLEHEFTDRGKWMDGWESRRKRGPGHDWCIIRLGAPGVLHGVDIDTQHFKGNHPPYASIEAVRAPLDADLATLEAADWVEVLPQVTLNPDSQNLFAIRSPDTFTHVRLNIFPDGGVARFRVYGEARPDWRPHADDAELGEKIQPGEVDLAAMRNGGTAPVCSDMFFGPKTNLILPGRAENMGGGWETRRRRGPGHDWIIVKLGARGTADFVEVSTHHFKGNYPDRFTLEGLDAPGARLTDLVDPATKWQQVLPETKLAADTRFYFREQIQAHGPFTHVRLSVFPDGGVSRLRVYGKPGQ